MALRSANSGASDCCCAAACSEATETAIRCSGVRGSLDGAAICAAAAGRIGREAAASADADPVPCPTTASRMTPLSVCDTANCKFWPGLQRHFRDDIDGEIGDRDANEVGGKHVLHLRAHHRAGLQHERRRSAASPLGCDGHG